MDVKRKCHIQPKIPVGSSLAAWEPPCCILSPAWEECPGGLVKPLLLIPRVWGELGAAAAGPWTLFWATGGLRYGSQHTETDGPAAVLYVDFNKSPSPCAME